MRADAEQQRAEGRGEAADSAAPRSGRGRRERAAGGRGLSLPPQEARRHAEQTGAGGSEESTGTEERHTFLFRAASGEVLPETPYVFTEF